MSKKFTVTMSVSVTVDAENEEAAEDNALEAVYNDPSYYVAHDNVLTVMKYEFDDEGDDDEEHC